MTLVPLPAFADHSVWMLHDGREAVVVDPDADAPARAGHAQGLRLGAF